MLQNSILQPLIELLRPLYYLDSTQSLLSWDQETYMPAGAIDCRSQQLAVLSGLRHEKFTSQHFRDVLSEYVDCASGDIINTKLNDKDQALVREVYRDWKRATCLPTDFVADYSQSVSMATHAWQTAMKDDNWNEFSPHLTALVDKSKQMAEFINSDISPYNVLLDEYEPGLKEIDVQKLFDVLIPECRALLKKIKTSSTLIPILDEHSYSETAQWDMTMSILKRMGFNFSKGRQDISTHPFTINCHPDDVRVTTRLSEHQLFEAITSSVHEGGHALYEQGLDAQYFGTPLCEAASLGVHESQSRLWENHICKTEAFCSLYYSDFLGAFPELRTYSSLDLNVALNDVQPGLIRVEADEVTYHFHVFIRFECERALFSGQCSVSDLPDMWNSLYTQYLGVTPTNFSNGVLQDIHWAGGNFGYFPTYTIGSLYAAQLYETFSKTVPDIESFISSGDWHPLREWLREHIHCHGRRYSAETLMKRVTGEPLSSAAYLRLIKQKLKSVYSDVLEHVV